jgi:YD repeat-containing protein
LTEVLDPTAKKTTYQYDPVGRLTDVRDPTDSGQRDFPSRLGTSMLRLRKMAISASKRRRKKAKSQNAFSRNATEDAWQRAVKRDGTRTDWTETRRY